MPERLVDFITSLDGYASAEGWPGFWGMEGPEYQGWLDLSPEGDYTTPSRWSPVGYSTAGSSCSSTCPQSSLVRRAAITRRPNRGQSMRPAGK